MSVQVATCSAAQLFSECLHPESLSSANTIFTSDNEKVAGALTIPEYQRPYCWQDKQLHGLLQDIESHTQRDAELPYYLGSLILHQEAGKLNIIDGQQRITTLALMGCLLESDQTQMGGLVYEHPTSQQQIKHNLKWLGDRLDRLKNQIDFKKLQFTLVITQSEDDAYRFFETQNTGGVRLKGPDIIKAHHLRAVDKPHQARFAQRWEEMGELDDVINALLKGRYWQDVKLRDLPAHNEKTRIRDTIVAELATDTGTGEDIAYGRVRRQTGLAGETNQQYAQQGYEVRQPLNAGINAIRYLDYFQGLYQRYWKEPECSHLEGYKKFVAWLKKLEGCGYLQGLYEACLMLYISQFGEDRLELAAKKIFRVVYARRVSNQKSVRENSIPAFIKETPVLDWIALSYTPEQCFSFLDAFELTVDKSNLDNNNNKSSVKRRYMGSVSKQFGLGLSSTEDFEKEFAPALGRKIKEAFQ